MKTWSLNKKIWSVLAFLMLTSTVSLGFALKNLETVRGNLNDITEKDVNSEELVATTQDTQRQLVISIYEMYLEQDTEKLKALVEKFDKLTLDIDKFQIEYQKIGTPEGVALFEKYKGFYDNWVKEARKSQKLLFAGHPKEGLDTLLAAASLRKTTLQILSDLKDMSYKTTDAHAAESNALATHSFWLALFVAIASFGTSLIIAFFTLRSVTRNVNDIVKGLFINSTEVSSAAVQIARSSEALSQCATEQAASLQESAASIEEMSSMVHKNSENAASTASTSTRSQEKAENGKRVVEKMIQSMAEINQSNTSIMNQVNQSNERFGEIVKVIEAIGTKTKVINDIVFQTKLLSFNASVEAARAGEHGKGFAVVAEEVGTLAQMSGNAAKEISDLLDGSIQRVNDIVSSTRQSVEKLVNEGKVTVESGTRVAEQCGSVLEEIVTNVASVSHMAGEIASASEEQSRGVSEITKAMALLDQVTQQNSTGSEETARAADSLSTQAESLSLAVKRLVAVVEGDKLEGQSSEKTPTKKTASRSTSSAQKPAPRKEVLTQAKPEMAKVVALKSKQKLTQAKPAFKSAVGDGSVPSSDDERFTDV